MHHFSAVETLLELEQSDLAALGEERLNRKDIDSYVAVSPFLSRPVQSVNCFAELLIVVSRVHLLVEQEFHRVALAVSRARSVRYLKRDPIASRERLSRDRSSGHDFSYAYVSVGLKASEEAGLKRLFEELNYFFRTDLSSPGSLGSLLSSPSSSSLRKRTSFENFGTPMPTKRT